MSTWTDGQETRYAQYRRGWFLANSPTWLCHGSGCFRVVEYAPEFAAVPCDHTAYCAGCVDGHVVCPASDEWLEIGPDAPFVEHTGDCICGFAAFSTRLRGPGAQSYAAHVAAGTLR